MQIHFPVCRLSRILIRPVRRRKTKLRRVSLCRVHAMWGGFLWFAHVDNLTSKGHAPQIGADAGDNMQSGSNNLKVCTEKFHYPDC